MCVSHLLQHISPFPGMSGILTNTYVPLLEVRMRTPLDEQQVKEILRMREEKLNTIHDKIYQIKKDMLNTDSVIEMVSLGSKMITELPSGGGSNEGLERTYMRYQQKLEEQNKEYQIIITKLMIKEDCINRVWSAFLALNEPEYGIVDRLYVHGEKYNMTQLESGFSLQVFEKYRKRAIDNILALYNSDLNEVDFILEISTLTQKKKRKKKEES